MRLKGIPALAHSLLSDAIVAAAIPSRLLSSASKKDVFNAAKVPGIEELLREKRLRWFGQRKRVTLRKKR